jgi:hypothetical protein
MYLDIYEAIEHRHLIQVYYGGYFRIIEPHIYGNDINGTDVLKAYQVAGANELGRHVGWRWFKVSKIDSIKVLPTAFPASRSSEGVRERALQRVYCEVSSSPSADPSPEFSSYRHR